jgi:hypothetical protein
MKEYLEPTKYLKINLIGRVVKNAWMIVGVFLAKILKILLKQKPLSIYHMKTGSLFGRV